MVGVETAGGTINIRMVLLICGIINMRVVLWSAGCLLSKKMQLAVRNSFLFEGTSMPFLLTSNQ